MILAAAITVGSLFSLIIYILVNGVVHLKPELFAWEYNTKQHVHDAGDHQYGVYYSTVSSDGGSGRDIFGHLSGGIRQEGQQTGQSYPDDDGNFAGDPSIVYGLFGYILFVITLGWSYSMLAGSVTLAIMILPLIIRTTEEALISVPDSYREGSFGLGAGKLRTVFKIILPCAVPGILAGVILAIGRIVGESAALIFTSGTVAQVPGSLFDSARTLSVHMYALLSEGLYTNEAYATAVVLLVLVILINAFSGFIAKKTGNEVVKYG